MSHQEATSKKKIDLSTRSFTLTVNFKNMKLFLDFNKAHTITCHIKVNFNITLGQFSRELINSNRKSNSLEKN